MNSSKRKRAQDDEEVYSPQRKQAFTDEVVKERQAEKALRSMSIESRAHCAKFPFWAVATWQERYIIANEEPMHDMNKIEERWPGLRARQAAHEQIQQPRPRKAPRTYDWRAVQQVPRGHRPEAHHELGTAPEEAPDERPVRTAVAQYQLAVAREPILRLLLGGVAPL